MEKETFFNFDSKDKIDFITACLNRGFSVRKNKDGFIVATVKNEDGVNIKFEVTPFDFDFKDGKITEPKVQVFENGQTTRDMIWRLSTFDVHL